MTCKPEETHYNGCDCHEGAWQTKLSAKEAEIAALKSELQARITQSNSWAEATTKAGEEIASLKLRLQAAEDVALYYYQRLFPSGMEDAVKTVTERIEKRVGELKPGAAL